ncbi:MAG: alkylresorcinol/alkylpyrone synthase [Mycobacterium sp.]|nr:alkylresorcinol/alkylpyrone synthase [Mycobacterium sp.]
MGTVSVIAGVQWALPPHRYSQHEVTESFIRFPGSEAFEDMVRKLYASSKVLESIRPTARLLSHLHPLIQHFVAHRSQIQALDRAPRCAALRDRLIQPVSQV